MSKINSKMLISTPCTYFHYTYMNASSGVIFKLNIIYTIRFKNTITIPDGASVHKEEIFSIYLHHI